MKKFIKQAFIVLCVVLAGTSEYIFPAQSLDFLNAKIKLTEDARSEQFAIKRLLSENLASDVQLDEYNKVNDTILDLNKQLGILESLRSGNQEFINQGRAQENSLGNKFIVIGSGLVVISACVGLGLTKIYNLTFNDLEKQSLSHPTACNIVGSAPIASVIGFATTSLGLMIKYDIRF